MALNTGFAPQGQNAISPLPYPAPQGQHPPQGQYLPAVPYPHAVSQGQYPIGPYHGPQPGQHLPQPSQNVTQGQYTPYPAVASAQPGMQYPAVTTPGGQTPWNPNQATNYTGTDIGDEDADENAPLVALAPSAPKYEVVIAGYENVMSASQLPVGPPPPYDAASDMPPAMVDMTNPEPMAAEEAREVLEAFVAKQCCWGGGAAKNMSIKDVKPTFAYHYVLETFTEGRKTDTAYVPYGGGFVDGPENGAAPLPWEIPCNPGGLFKNEVQTIAVPHTEIVSMCHQCHGSGYNRCHKCLGRGKVRCGHCSGRGHRRVHRDGHWQDDRCSWCHGNGRRTCTICHGTGCIICVLCTGYRNVKQFIRLTIAFSNRLSEHILERTDLPNNLIKQGEGDTIFEQTLPYVGPIRNFFDDEINQKSKELVDRHATSWPTDRVLQQRHHLRSVPVHECLFEYSGKEGRFWVYGQNKQVYTKDYPHTCCCCTIL